MDLFDISYTHFTKVSDCIVSYFMSGGSEM